MGRALVALAFASKARPGDNTVSKLLCAARLLAVTLIASSSSFVNAQTTAAGPYYATPSWDQTLPASTRFIILSNFTSEAVLDRDTGLVWERSPSTLLFDGAPP